jgi:signal transduction histidine kinase
MGKDLSKRIIELELECERKQKELRDSQIELVQMEKMAALGSLSAGLVHELNAPVAAINSNNDVIELTLQKLDELIKSLPRLNATETDSQLRELMTIAWDSLRTNRLACERIIKFVHSVRNFSRLDESDRKQADVEECIESTLTLLAHELRGRISVVKEYGETPEIECYPNQLGQVFMNILLNAAQAIEGEGEIRIRTWIEAGDVRIAVSDTGRGIPPDIQARIFDPGFTTKKAGVGSGLGLSICRKIIDNHHGRIELQSEVGRGSTFTVVLPVGHDRERTANGNTNASTKHPHR